MITTIHLLIGALIGKSFKSIWLIIILALLSHYILDFIPHTSPSEVDGYLDGGLKGVSNRDLILKSIEPILGLILVGYFIYLNKEKALLMAVGAFFAWCPDLIGYFAWLDTRWNLLDKIVPRHGNFLYNEAKSLIVGILTQAVVFITTLMLLILPRK